MPVSKSRRKKQTGQSKRIGRFGFSGFKSQRVALRLALWAGALAGLLLLGSSTLVGQGALQRLERGHDLWLTGGTSYYVGASGVASSNKRYALFRYVQKRAGAVRNLSDEMLVLLFGTPSLERQEGDVRVWQFVSGVCALDVYYRDAHSAKPLYAEFRVRGGVEGKGRRKMQSVRQLECVESLFLNRVS